ncbi:caspase family protein [Pseudooceanicola pacificus]|nr:caspase family protein [Pseudooceanicola pacificus]
MTRLDPRIARLVAVALTLTFAPQPGLAKVLGLVVGVSDYEYLDADLRGPANDVGLVARMLLARGAAPADVTVLAAPDAPLPGGLAPAAQPRRAAIVAALEGLAATARPGDTVVFYFSGHGSQMPDASGDEAGGYDEILLPSDARDWKGAIGAVENALVDDELGVMMQAILDTGAELVAILDACHSATGFRDIAGNGAARYVDPALLGVPDAQAGDAEAGQVAPPLNGRFVFLYSSQSDQRSFEYPLGDAGDPASWYGDFTGALMPVLTAGQGLSWAQALMAATDGMSRSGPAAQTPDAEGTLLEAPVFGTGTGQALWRTEGRRVAAGLLAGLGAGAQLAVYADAAASGTPVLAEVAELRADSAMLAGGEGLPAQGYARLNRPAPPAPLALAAPVAADGGDYAALAATLAEVTANLDGIAPADAGRAAMTPYFTGGTLALAGRDGVLDGAGPGSSPRLSGGETGPQAVAAFLDRAARAHALRTALGMAEGGGLSAFALPGVGLQVALTQVGGGAECDGSGAETPVTGAATVQDCDQLWLSVTNGSRTARDITVLYLDRDLAVTALWPEGGLSNRLGFGETQEIGLQITNPSDLPGSEELIVLSAPAVQGAPRTVLTALADPVQMRAAAPESGPLAQYLMAAADPSAQQRNLPMPGAVPRLEVTRFRISLAPAGIR